MFSTSNNHHHIKEAQRLGAALYMIKPSDYIVLKKRICQIISDDDFVGKLDFTDFLVL